MADALDDSTKLAYDRTWLAEERTAMAWIRTATSLITFGFAIYSFFGIPSGAGHRFTGGHVGATIFAAMLICIGLVSLVSAAIQRRHALHEMKKHYPQARPRSTAAIVGALVGLLGITALGFLIFRF